MSKNKRKLTKAQKNTDPETFNAIIDELGFLFSFFIFCFFNVLSLTVAENANKYKALFKKGFCVLEGGGGY